MELRINDKVTSRIGKHALLKFDFCKADFHIQLLEPFEL